MLRLLHRFLHSSSCGARASTANAVRIVLVPLARRVAIHAAHSSVHAKPLSDKLACEAMTILLSKPSMASSLLRSARRGRDDERRDAAHVVALARGKVGAHAGRVALDVPHERVRARAEELALTRPTPRLLDAGATASLVTVAGGARCSSA